LPRRIVTRSRYRTWRRTPRVENDGGFSVNCTKKGGKRTDLERDEERDGFDRVVAAVDIVTHEKVVCVRRVPTDPEQFRQVVLWWA
jgi:hypothetical protein